MQTLIYVISIAFLSLKRDVSPAKRPQQRGTRSLIWLAIGLHPNRTPTPIPPPPGGILLIREPYQSPEHAFDSFLKDDLPDQNKNVEKCEQQSEDFKSSSSL